MKRLAKRVWLTGLLVVGVAAPAAAVPVTITATDSGYYTQTGIHSPGSTNYLVGNCCGIGGIEYRNWFVFDLTSLAGQTITAASLALTNPLSGYVSADANETFGVFDVSTSLASLQAGGSGLFTTFADLGTGTSYGARTVSAADNNTVVVTSLNASGLAALNAAIGGSTGLGGAITTLSGNPQSLFGTTVASPTRELRLEIEPTVASVPEPTTLALAGVGLGLLAAQRRSRRAGDRRCALSSLPCPQRAGAIR